MGRTAKPWWWEERKAYYATIHGVRHRLGTNKAEATRLCKRLTAQPPKSKPTSSDAALAIIDQFLAYTKKKRTEETYKWYRKHLQAFATDLESKNLHQISAANLKTHHIQDWIDSHENWSDGTKHGAWRAINRAFNWAMKQEYVDRNPALNVEKPAPPTRQNLVSADQFQELLSHIIDDDFKDLLWVHWETGCRPQESLRVEKANVQEQCWLFQPDEGKKHHNRKHIRFVYLSDRALEITRRRMLRFPTGPLFRNTEENPWTPFSVNCRFKRLVKHIGRKICLYDLRHSFDDRMRRAGLDSMDIAALLGHADLSMLGRVYSHPHANPERLIALLSKASA